MLFLTCLLVTCNTNSRDVDQSYSGDKKDEYLGDCELLESQTDDFAYYYLDQCRTMWEALLLLHDQQVHDQNIDLLQYALKRKKMKFISHHFCQQYIMDTWYLEYF